MVVVEGCEGSEEALGGDEVMVRQDTEGRDTE